jgi:hypothetical protein
LEDPKFLSFQPKYIFSTSRHQFISEGKQGTNLEQERESLGPYIQVVPVLKDAEEEIGGGLVVPSLPPFLPSCPLYFLPLVQ